jgi:hypothetical protein
VEDQQGSLYRELPGQACAAVLSDPDPALRSMWVSQRIQTGTSCVNLVSEISSGALAEFRAAEEVLVGSGSNAAVNVLQALRPPFITNMVSLPDSWSMVAPAGEAAAEP